MKKLLVSGLRYCPIMFHVGNILPHRSCRVLDIVPGFAQNELDILSQSPIVPKTISGEERKWLNPAQCYLGTSMKHDLYSKLFHFVNFGSGAIQFLRACGARNEPSEEDVAECLADNHDEFFRLARHER